MKHEKTSRSSTLKNTLQLLKLFSAEQPEWGISQLARELGLAKSTVHRMLTTLVSTGFVIKNPETHRYHLSARLLHLGHTVISQHPVYHQAKPVLHKLVRQTGETAHLSILKGVEVIYLYKVECQHPVRLPSYVGLTNPAFCTASGQAILAYHPEKVEQVLTQGLSAYTPHTPATREALMGKLAKVREKGVAISIEELEEGVYSIAAPIFDPNQNKVIAAISIAGPTQRLTAEKLPVLVSYVKQAAKLSGT